MLTAILPLRVRNGHEDAIRRLDFALSDKVRPREVGFLVLDDGSAADLAEMVGERFRVFAIGDGGAGVLGRSMPELRGDGDEVVFAAGERRFSLF